MMSLYRVALAACAVLLATVFSSAAFAGCCGGCGGCGGYVVMTYAPAPVQYAVPVPAPVAPLPIAPAPIGVDHWDTGGWGGWNNWSGGGSWGGCGCCCNRGLFTNGFFGSPAVAPIYIVNQGPQYSGPGIMIPSLSYSPGEGVAAPGAYPYIGHYPYRPYYSRYARGVHRYYWHYRHPLHTRG